MPPIFRLDAPTAEHIAAFHRDGYIAMPDIFTDAARMGLIDEVMQLDDVQAYFRERTLQGKEKQRQDRCQAQAEEEEAARE